MGTTVTYRNISKHFGDVVAVDDFSLEIDDGEFLVLVGPSGCGKSTLLRMTAGLEDITAGDLEIEGERVNELEAGERDLAMVFQSYALYPHRSVRGNLAYALRLRRVPKADVDARVEAVARMLEITELLDRRPKQLSGGQAQRVALGRAIIRQPKVFLMDEPLSNLDAKLRAQMRTELIRLHRTVKTTTIYVTHDQVEAMTMGTRIVVLNHGVLQQVGSPRDVYQKPANVFVAGFMGAPPMNLLEAELRDHGDDLHVERDDLDVVLPDRLASAVRRGDASRTVTFGVRPEDLVVGDGGAGDERVQIDGIVDVVELLGGESYMHVLSGGERITAKVDASIEPPSGTAIQLSADRADLHIFDGASGRRIDADAVGTHVGAS